MIIVALDASRTGAVCVVGTDGDLVTLERFPVVESDSRDVLDTSALRRLLIGSRDHDHARHLRGVLDRHELGSSAVVNGVRALFSDMNIPLELAPNGWREELGVQANTALIISKAQLAVPGASFTGAHAVARARCVLLARLCWRLSRRASDDDPPFPSAPTGRDLAAKDGRALSPTHAKECNHVELSSFSPAS